MLVVAALRRALIQKVQWAHPALMRAHAMIAGRRVPQARILWPAGSDLQSPYFAACAAGTMPGSFNATVYIIFRAVMNSVLPSRPPNAQFVGVPMKSTTSICLPSVSKTLMPFDDDVQIRPAASTLNPSGLLTSQCVRGLDAFPSAAKSYARMKPPI